MNTQVSAIGDGVFGIAALQLAVSSGDNLQQLVLEIGRIAKRYPWVRMVMTSELCGLGASPDNAQCMPGTAENMLRDAAREHGLWVVPGSLYEEHEGEIYNTTPVINPDGDVVARYRKIYPFYPYERGITPGDDFVVFDVPGAGRFGVSICYDMWFPETSRSLISMGAEVILHPVLTSTVDRDVEIAMARSTAATNQCYVVDVNAGGDLGVGQSALCGPGGELVYKAGGGRDIMAFALDFNYLRRCREHGWQGLGQPLKSFRDHKVVFPAYGSARADSPALSALGPLKLPGQPD